MAKSIAKIKVKAECVAAFQQAVAELAIPTRKEAGCVFYELYQMKDEKEVFFFMEEWKSEDDLKQHLSSPHVKAFGEKVDPMTDGDVQPFFWNKVV